MTDPTALERPRRYGCIPDHPDKRDLMFAAPRVALPAKVDLSAILPPVLDQGRRLNHGLELVPCRRHVAMWTLKQET